MPVLVIAVTACAVSMGPRSHSPLISTLPPPPLESAPHRRNALHSLGVSCGMKARG